MPMHIGMTALRLQLEPAIRCCELPAIRADAMRGKNRLPNANILLVVPVTT
jgi:hypothetical protein